MTPDEIVSHIPTISLADVHSALAYYFDHVQEIQEEIREDFAYAEEMRERHPSLLKEKLRQERLDEASQLRTAPANWAPNVSPALSDLKPTAFRVQ